MNNGCCCCVFWSCEHLSWFAIQNIILWTGAKCMSLLTMFFKQKLWLLHIISPYEVWSELQYSFLNYLYHCFSHIYVVWTVLDCWFNVQACRCMLCNWLSASCSSLCISTVWILVFIHKIVSMTQFNRLLYVLDYLYASTSSSQGGGFYTNT